MASLTNTKIKNTYVSLLKVADNGQLDAALQDITDGAGNVTGVQLNTGGDLAASGTVSFGSLKDTGENITISKFVDAADGIGSNNNDTTIPTSAAVVSYVASQVTLEDLDFTGDSGTGAVDLDSQTLNIVGTANEIVTAAGAQTLTIGLPSTINVNVTGDLTGNVTATSVLVDGVIATTQTIGDNSTKVATTAYVDAAITAENLDIAGTSGTGSVDLDSQVLTIAGTANEVETSASGQTITVGLPSNVTIGNDLTVTTNATVGGTLGVTGATGVDGNFDVATNKFTVQAATGNTAVAGTLGVTGNTTLSTLDATGLASLDGGIDVDGAFTVADTTGNVSTTGTLAVTGITTLTDDLAVDTDTLFVDVSEDRVGINKAVPTVALDVVGDITSSATISGSTVSATTLTGTLSTAAQTNITSVGTLSSLAVSGNLTVDTNTLFVDAANNAIGIGSTSTGDNFAQVFISGANTDTDFTDLTGERYLGGAASLAITNTTSSDNTFASIGLAPRNAAGTLQNFSIIAQSATAGFSSSLIFTSRSSSSVMTERMRIDSSGNVGIGTTPDTKLDVNGVINVRTNGFSFGRITTNNTTGTDGGLTFQTISGGTFAERMRIDASGNVLLKGNGTSTVLTFDTSSYGQITSTGGTLFYDVDAHIFRNNAGFEKMRILSTGGITFNGDTAAANALDDYEEGTFTPSLVYSTSGTPTYANQLGRYTKVGRMVQVQIYLSWNENGALGNISITGFPFTSVNSLARGIPSILSFGLTGLPIAVSITGILVNNTTGMSLFLNDNAATNFSDTYTDNDQDVLLTLTYEAA